MKYGYARVSTDDQKADMQHAALKKAGCNDVLGLKLANLQVGARGNWRSRRLNPSQPSRPVKTAHRLLQRWVKTTCGYCSVGCGRHQLHPADHAPDRKSTRLNSSHLG